MQGRGGGTLQLAAAHLGVREERGKWLFCRRRLGLLPVALGRGRHLSDALPAHLAQQPAARREARERRCDTCDAQHAPEPDEDELLAKPICDHEQVNEQPGHDDKEVRHISHVEQIAPALPQRLERDLNQEEEEEG